VRKRILDNMDERRRQIIKLSMFGALAAAAGVSLSGCGGGGSPSPPPPSSPPPPPTTSFGPLQAADSNGIRTPAGFTTRIVARSGQTPLAGTGFAWHAAPDGGATFPVPDGGWVYVSNSEMPANGGGAGALRFDSSGQIIGAYSILENTTDNCAGGPTPWGTWLSCEEFDSGTVWECDPMGLLLPAHRPALGSFKHEAAAVDPQSGIIYLTEDQTDGCLYRFTPAGRTQSGAPDLSSGLLEVAEVTGGDEGLVVWHTVPDPDGAVVPTRFQVAASTVFNRGEGAWFDSDKFYFSTTGDNRIWVLDVRIQELNILYDDDMFADPILRGVDNITVSPRGDVIVAEDGDDMQLVAITPSGDIEPILQIVGHDESEITGPAFDPSGTRLYLSSQRGSTNLPEDGVTYEISGPFPI
jgi:secreted PhoX family phosphatase